jgi:hypothetical protein
VLAVMRLMKECDEKFSGNQVFLGRGGENILSLSCLGQEVMEDSPPPVGRKCIQ